MKSKFYLILIGFFAPIGFLFSQNVGISTGAFTPAERLHVDGSARIDNALIVNPQTVAAAATITVAARTTAINITATGGTQANAVTYSPTPTSGQVMYIFDGDNDAATFASYTIPAGGFGTFVYLSSAWRVVSIGNNGAPSGAAGGDLTGTYPNPTVATSAINSAKIADGTVTGTDLATNTVANSNLAQMPAYSIKANLTGSTANAADATASADGQVLRRAAGALTFGTIDGSSFGSQAANTVFAAPNGSAGNPTFRALVAADLPTGSTGYIQNNAVGANFATGQAASFDITGNGEINGTLNINGNVGLGLTSTNNKLDIAGATRGGTHATGRPLYVTGTFSAAANGVEFRHDNGTQGVGIGFNTIYATGSNANQDLGLAALGTTGNLTFTTNATNRMTISGTGTVTVPNLGGSGTRLVTADAAGLLATSTTAALTLPTGTGANGQVTYWTGTNTQAGNNNLYWDNTNGRLGIGTTGPSFSLHVNGVTHSNKYVVQNGVDGTNAKGIWMWTGTDPNWGIYMGTAGAGKSLNNGTAPSGTYGAASHSIRIRTYNDASNAFIYENSAEQTNFSVRASDGSGYFRGNLGIGTASPSYTLHTNGYMYTEQGAYFACSSCGSTGAFVGSSNWGVLTIQGRVLSSNSNIHLSPPGGARVIINSTYRAGGGSTGTTGLDIEDGGIRMNKTIYFFQRYRYCNCFGAGAGTWDIGNFDFCAVAQVGFKNNQSNADEDDDIQCAVWPIDATGGAPGEQSNYNTTLYYNYASKPYWRMYAEAYEDSNGVTCGANCINFE